MAMAPKAERDKTATTNNNLYIDFACIVLSIHRFFDQFLPESETFRRFPGGDWVSRHTISKMLKRFI